MVIRLGSIFMCLIRLQRKSKNYNFQTKKISVQISQIGQK